jgi:hypothetical protein
MTKQEAALLCTLQLIAKDCYLHEPWNVLEIEPPARDCNASHYADLVFWALYNEICE